MKKMIIGLCLLLPATLRAQTSALEDLQAAAGAQGTALDLGRRQTALKNAARVQADPADVLGRCGELSGTESFDADPHLGFWDRWERDAVIVQGCLDRVYKGRSYSVRAEPVRGLFCGDRWTNNNACDGGIAIRVDGAVPQGDPVVSDLHYAVDVVRRRVLLSGHEVLRSESDGNTFGWHALVVSDQVAAECPDLKAGRPALSQEAFRSRAEACAAGIIAAKASSPRDLAVSAKEQSFVGGGGRGAASLTLGVRLEISGPSAGETQLRDDLLYSFGRRDLQWTVLALWRTASSAQ